MRRVVTFTSGIAGVCLVTLTAWPFLQSRKAEAPAPDSNQHSLATIHPQSSAVQETAPTESTILGYTKRKTPIKALFIGSGKTRVIVLGAIHGDEPSSASVVEAFATRVAKDQFIKDMTVIVIPALNPEGLQSESRTNHSGVDINRNFPAKTWQPGANQARYYPGKKPSSEPETRAIIALIQKSSPSLIISVHAPLNCVNWDGPGQTIAASMAEANGYPMCQDIGYPTPGSLGSYAGKDLNIPVLTLELREARSSDKITEEGVVALQAAIKWLAMNRN